MRLALGLLSLAALQAVSTLHQSCHAISHCHHKSLIDGTHLLNNRTSDALCPPDPRRRDSSACRSAKQGPHIPRDCKRPTRPSSAHDSIAGHTPKTYDIPSIPRAGKLARVPIRVAELASFVSPFGERDGLSGAPEEDKREKSLKHNFIMLKE